MAATIPPGLEDVLSIDPEIMHGALCFKGTRLPLNVLLDNLTEGIGVDQFVEAYEADRDKIMAFVEWQVQCARRQANLGPED
jgi:uncharacterized protein (DUF433 family)